METKNKETFIKKKEVFSSYLPFVKKYKKSVIFLFFIVISWNILDIYFPLYFLKITKTLELSRDNFTFSQIKPLYYVFLLMMITRWILRRTDGFVFDYLIANILHDIRVTLFEKLIRKNHNFFINNFSGSLLNKFNKYVNTFAKISRTLMNDFIPFFIKVFGLIFAISIIDQKYTKIFLVFSVIFSLTSMYFIRSKYKIEIESSRADSKTSGALADAISNQSSIQFFDGYNSEVDSIKKVAENQKILNKKNWYSWLRISAYQSFLANMLDAYILYNAFSDFESGILTLAALFIVRDFTGYIIDKLWNIASIIRIFHEGFSESYEMVEIIRSKDEICDEEDALTLNEPINKIDFINVGYSYNKLDKVIENFNLEIKENQKIALVGLSGGGKTTIVKLLLRLFDVTDGEIKINNFDIRKIKQSSLRNVISFVPQDTSLFHRTLNENIKYGKPDATDEEVIAAAKKAHAHEFIEKLPKGYETLVGERGIKLSGGERQRIAIARAILKDAPILVLDEATSALDSETESKIQDALEELMRGKTVIAIAHRLSTIKKMDSILVLENGKISENGTHDELLKNKKSTYKKLWDMQAGGFIKEEEVDSKL